MSILHPHYEEQKKTGKRQSKSAHTWFGSAMNDFETPLTNNRLIPPQ